MKTTVSRPVGAARKKPVRKERTQAQKAEETRQALIDSAARVIGRVGYEGASISTITANAHVAQGTFYNYFESRQDLFDQLLPIMGRAMTDYIKVRMNPAFGGPDRERQRVNLYFDFLREHPWFHRLVNEAETMAPKGHQVYFKHISSGYIRSLERSLARGEIRGYESGQLEPLAYMLLSIRTYLAQRYAFTPRGAFRKIPAEVVETYVEFITRALFY